MENITKSNRESKHAKSLKNENDKTYKSTTNDELETTQKKDWDNSSYKCNKCRDLTFIINDGVATPCECRAVKEDKDILRKSGISEEFRNKNFETLKL